MCKAMKLVLTWLMLGILLPMTEVVAAASFTSSEQGTVCSGDIQIEPSGLVRCTATGTTLMASCAGDVVFDTNGVIRCFVTEKPACTLTAVPATISVGASTNLFANCMPAVSSYIWENTGFSSNANGGTVRPTTSTIYYVTGVNSAGAGNRASAAVTVLGTTTTPTTPPSGPPTCTLTSSSGSFVYGMTDTLTANCNPVATSYAWSANTNGCSSSSASCPVGPTVTTTYTVTGSNSLGNGNTASTTVVKSMVCTLTATPDVISAGASATLTASCLPAASSYTWTNTPATFTASTASGSVSPSVTTTYTVVGNSASNETSSPVSVTVTVTRPTCTLNANPSGIGNGGSATLTANCTPAATSYTWTNTPNTFTATTASGSVSPAVTTTYTVVGNFANNETSEPVSATVTVGPPVCSISALPETVTSGSPSTLTASCLPAATAYQWSDAHCLSTSATCVVNPTQTTTYTVTGTNGSGTGTPSAGKTVTVGLFCTLTAAPASIASGATSVLTASCPTATRYQWSDAGCSTASATCNVAPAQTTTYTVKGSSDGVNFSPAASATVTVTTTAPANCKIIDVTWPSGFGLVGIPQQTMNRGDMHAYRITLPVRPTTLTGVFYGTVPTQIAVSSSPCEWPDTRSIGCAAAGFDSAISNYTNGVSDGYSCSLTAGTTYYFNVKNAYTWNGEESCQVGQSCTHYFAW